MAAVNHHGNSKARETAYGGILGALTLLALFLATVLPTNRIFFYGLSSVFISVMVIEFGVAKAWVFYAATSLLALILIPDKIRLIPYIIILGHYGIWKTYLERLPRIAGIFLKLAVLNLTTIIAYFLVREFFLSTITLPLNIWLVLAGLQILFLIYDYFFTVSISFYLKRIRPMVDK